MSEGDTMTLEPNLKGFLNEVDTNNFLFGSEINESNSYSMKTSLTQRKAESKSIGIIINHKSLSNDANRYDKSNDSDTLSSSHSEMQKIGKSETITLVSTLKDLLKEENMDLSGR
jgi:hypothetical protein